MNATYRIALVLLAVVAAALTGSAQYQVPRSVMSAGGAPMTGTSTSAHGTVSQTAIGIVRSPLRTAEQGFWYQVHRIDDGSGWHTSIILPHVKGNNGQTVDIPIMMRTTQRMFNAELSYWTARIEFNKTMLEPKNAMAVEETDSSYIVTYRGSATDTIQTIATMKAFVRLGNDSVSALSVASFQWDVASKMRIYTQPGSFTDLSICRAGGPRLVAMSGAPTITVMPQPIVERGEIRLTIPHATMATVSLFNGSGIIVRTLFNGPVSPGTLVIPFEAELLASGAYVVSVETPTDIVGQQFLISR